MTKESINTQSRKNKIYYTLTRPVATYKAEAWTLSKDISKRLADFERKVLRRMFGGIKVNENCRKRYNKELISCLEI